MGETVFPGVEALLLLEVHAPIHRDGDAHRGLRDADPLIERPPDGQNLRAIAR
jgi:hypothetical protein